jgi:ribosomal protein S18 acetylase RimI-like enzyme
MAPPASDEARADALLDNPVWHALRGPLAGCADAASTDRAVRFDPEINLFAGIERTDPSGWAALAELAGPGGFAVLFRDHVPAPPVGWQEHYRAPCFQMVAADLPPRPGIEVLPLGAADAPEMLALAQLTEPGPFFPRTHELGRYVGVRRGGRLVAMAGERFRVPGFTEVSAVCTHPDVRGEGLGGALTLEIAWGIRDRGDEAFLHLLATNETAHRLYLKLGFRDRLRPFVVAAQWHADGRPADAIRDTDDASAIAALPHPAGPDRPREDGDAG